MNHELPGGRHRRRRQNTLTRATLDEARRAGLVQRHLTKLRYLADRARPAPEPPPRAPEAPEKAPPSTSDAA
ncbi:hypothetical protein [Amycolatopsis sp. CA-128772]|uniref:hypothetical protein n=1 Tax=Amycolatopsis sp. CA-128772 TaxID=2073159 RepID=UPI0011B08D6A|nr:hypothetical protein [Amycolatopsis sp. CA-128772]